MPPTICLPLNITEAWPKFYGLCPKVNQVIYTLDTIWMPNIMILVQAVLQTFCSQGHLCLSLKRGIIQSNIHRILWKVNQVIYIMISNCMPDIMFLAQAILQFGCFTILYAKVGKGTQFSQIFTEFCQILIRSSTPWTQSHNPSFRGYPDILFTRSFMTWKEE